VSGSVAGRQWVWLLCVSLPVWAAPTAHLDRTQVTLGETLQLIVAADPDDRDAEPDLTPLKKDFEIRGSSQSTQVQIINGHSSMSANWIIDLEPRHSGIIRIPSLRVGRSRTRPLVLRVVDAPSISGNPRGDVFLDLGFEPSQVYVGQQLTVRVQIWHAIGFVNASLDDLDVPGAQVSRLGDDVAFSADRDHTRFQVVERRYAVLPGKSGVLHIPQLNFTGVTTAPVSGSLFGMQRFFSTGGRRVHAASKALDIAILAVPKQADPAHWLPARSLDFIDNWGSKVPEFRVGQPVTRNLTQHATGVLADQLPEIRSPPVEGLRQYPDQPDLSNGVDGQWLDARRTDHIAYVPIRAGKMTLPELKVTWWDVTRQVPRQAVIAAREITVLPAANAQPALPQGPAPASPQATAPVTPSGSSRPTTAPPKTTTEAAEAVQPGPPWRDLALGFALLWLATLLLWQRSRRPSRAAPPRTPKHMGSRKAFIAACRRRDVEAATAAVLGWARATPPCSALSIPALAEYLGESEFSTALETLDGSRFGDASEVAWETLMAQCPKSLDATAAQPDDGEPLTPLYPD